MPKSAAKIATSCFAALACLLCVSAAPVAGQDVGQNKPAALPSVSSPSASPTTSSGDLAKLANKSQTTTRENTSFSTILPPQWVSLVPVFVAFIAGAFTAFLSPLVTYLLGERGRRLDLYKIYYPLKVNAIKEINEGLIACASSYTLYVTDKSNQAWIGKLTDDLSSVQLKIKGLACFLDNETERLTDECEKALEKSLSNPEDESERFWEAYKKLTTTYPIVLHKRIFDKLL